MNIFKFSDLIDKVDHHVESYKNDLNIDKNEFINNTPFIHIARKTGSRMITKHEFMQVADRIIADPHGRSNVLFSSVPNSELLQLCYDNNIHTLEYDTRQKEDILIHYFNGEKLEQLQSIDTLYAGLQSWLYAAKCKIEDQ